MSESTNTAAREALEGLVWGWAMEAAPPDGPPWPGEARVSFEWLEGGPLLVQRWHIDLPEAPDGVAVIRVRRDERELLPALHRRAGRPAHLQDEPD